MLSLPTLNAVPIELTGAVIGRQSTRIIMKNNDCRLFPTLLLTSLLILCQAVTGWSQTDRIGDFIKTGGENAETLTKAYFAPVPRGIGANLNTGWFTSASTHHTLGFDIQIRGALAFIPSSDQDFNFDDLNLTNLELADPNASPLSPTAGGDDAAGPEVIIRDDNGDEVDRFNLPQGSGYHIAPAPIVQASVGLIGDTDLIARFVPEVKIGDYGNFNMKGFGLKHEINQWFPGGGLLPVDISIMAGYNRININTNLDLDPKNGAVPTDPTENYENQKVETSFDTFTAKVLVGKDLPFISVYGGLGYETSVMNLDVTGNFPVTELVAGQEVTTTLQDPFSYSENGANKFSLTGGVNFKLFFFNVFGEYTLADYPVANAGVGFSFR